MVEEDEWGSPTGTDSVAAATSGPVLVEEDDWGFPLEKQQSFHDDAAPGKSSSKDEDEWGFDELHVDEKPVTVDIGPRLSEDEWGFPIDPSAARAKTSNTDIPENLGTESGPSREGIVQEFKASTSPPTASLFEGWKTATRTNKLGTSLSTFTTILSNLDIPGPEHLLVSNLKDRGVKIGQGTQFIVFRDQFSAEAEDGSGKIVEGKGTVIKRVRISKAALSAQTNLGENEQYLQTLRHLELEVLSLGLLKHRNIVRLTGWGYDYEDRYTPIPVLFMEAALAPLTDFLQAEKEGEGVLVELGNKRWDIKYHLTLDVAAGLEAIHALNIIHGDVKPDNVLVFRQDDPEVPYVGKLSDFGVCIDMRASGQSVTSETYLGTEAWTGSEVGAGQWDDRIHGTFEPGLMKQFDSYSFGLLLLSIFGTYGEPPRISKHSGPERALALFGEMEKTLQKASGCPEDVVKKLKEVAKKCLSQRPCDRPLPSPTLLQTELRSYHEWLRVSATAALNHVRVTQKGHAYWFALDMNVLKALDQQYPRGNQKGSPFTGEILFGMAEACSQQPIRERHKKVLEYILAAAIKGHSPARAICAKVYEAMNEKLEVAEDILEQWEQDAVMDGFLFDSRSFGGSGIHEPEREAFRTNGGFCEDLFLTQKETVAVARDPNGLNTWLATTEIDTVIDSTGNTMMHACAALGDTHSLEILLRHSEAVPLNEKGESPLYKACQAGHSEAVRFLLRQGHKPMPSKETGVSPLHWLFLFPDADIRDIAKSLTEHGNSVNVMIRPQRKYGRAQRYLMKHFPFEFPLGTPFHWAAFARNKVAMDVLLELGADVDATYDNGNHGTTPLAKAVYIADAELVQYLLRKGANTAVKNKEGENLLHTMSIGAGNERTLAGSRFDSWVRHGSWTNVVQAAKEVVRLLVDAGVDIEGKATTYGKYTPFLSAVVGTFRKEYVVAALLDAGADTAAVNASENLNALHVWCELEATSLGYPHVYEEILREIVRRTKALDVKGGSLEETALHLIVRNSIPTEKLLECIKLLLSDPTHCVDVNTRDRDGDTALIKTCKAGRAGMEDRLRCLLDHGARPDDMNDYQENFVHSLADNYTLMDNDVLNMLQLLFAHEAFTKEVKDHFIATTDLSGFASACTSGRFKTIEYLLSLGFSKRVNEPLTSQGVQTSVLDRTFFAANDARFTYIRYASELLTDEELDEADRQNRLYTTNAGVRGTYGGPSAERAREAYWAFPSIIKLLQAHGAKRVLLNNRGPAWTDATELPPLGLKYATQPHVEHWKLLYDLDILDKDFETEAWNEFKQKYSYISEEELDNVEIPVMVFERWPRVTKLLRRKEGYGEKVVKFLKRRKEGEEWFKGVLRDGRRVEVRMVGGKIAALRDLKGRAVDARVR